MTTIDLDDATVQAEARKLVEELYRELGEEPPELGKGEEQPPPMEKGWRVGRVVVKSASDWDEDKHPRDHGKFASKPGTSGGSKPSLRRVAQQVRQQHAKPVAKVPQYKRESADDYNDLQSIGKRIDELLGSDSGGVGEISNAFKEWNEKKELLKHDLRVRKNSKGKWEFRSYERVDFNRGGEIISEHDTEEDANNAAWADYDRRLKVYRNHYDNLEKLSRDLIAKETRLKESDGTQNGENSNEVDESHQDQINQARKTDEMFKGQGRYEAELWMKLKKKHPNAVLPKLSKHGAGYARDEYESDGQPVPDEVMQVLR